MAKALPLERRIPLPSLWERLGDGAPSSVAMLARHPQGGTGLLILLAMLALGAAAPALAAHSPVAQNLSGILAGPSLSHPLGTDELGRDVFSRILYGARVSLAVGAGSVLFGMLLGIPLGVLAGYGRGWADQAIMHVVDALLSFPALLLALAITAALGPDVRNVIIAIGVVQAPHFARLVRGQSLAVAELEFVEAARACGASARRICLRHLVPNVLAPIIVQATLSGATAILSEASLSFLGLGVQPPQPSWGSMLKTGYAYVGRDPWLGIFPGLAICLVVVAANLLGDGLRDVLDPKAQAKWRRARRQAAAA